MNTILAITCGKLKKELKGKKYYLFVTFFISSLWLSNHYAQLYKDTFLNHHQAVKCCCYTEQLRKLASPISKQLSASSYFFEFLLASSWFQEIPTSSSKYRIRLILFARFSRTTNKNKYTILLEKNPLKFWYFWNKEINILQLSKEKPFFKLFCKHYILFHQFRDEMCGWTSFQGNWANHGEVISVIRNSKHLGGTTWKRKRTWWTVCI